MLGWFKEHWVSPLNKAGADELLSTFGRRVGLDVGRQTKDLAFGWTGGHPLLHRQYGSALLALVQKENPDKESVETDPLRDRALDVFLERNAVTDIPREIYELLAFRYPEAEALLDELARADMGGREVLQRHGGFRGQAARVLRNFGLLGGTEEQPTLFEALKWYTRANRPINILEAS
jgi:hypothetical protein